MPKPSSSRFTVTDKPPEKGPRRSPLCRTVKKDGWDLDILIFEDEQGTWLLEIRNDTGVSTCWIDPFETEQAALDEALKTIEESGIEDFHAPQPWLVH